MKKRTTERRKHPLEKIERFFMDIRSCMTPNQEVYLIFAVIVIFSILFTSSFLSLVENDRVYYQERCQEHVSEVASDKECLTVQHIPHSRYCACWLEENTFGEFYVLPRSD